MSAGGICHYCQKRDCVCDEVQPISLAPGAEKASELGPMTEAMVNLRDEAIDAHRRGESEPMEIISEPKPLTFLDPDMELLKAHETAAPATELCATGCEVFDMKFNADKSAGQCQKCGRRLVANTSGTYDWVAPATPSPLPETDEQKWAKRLLKSEAECVVMMKENKRLAKLVEQLRPVESLLVELVECHKNPPRRYCLNGEEVAEYNRRIARDTAAWAAAVAHVDGEPSK